MTILHCPQVINENGEHESVSSCALCCMKSHMYTFNIHISVIYLSDGLCKEHSAASLVVTYY